MEIGGPINVRGERSALTCADAAAAAVDDESDPPGEGFEGDVIARPVATDGPPVGVG
jgi:hypothetical protein